MRGAGAPVVSAGVEQHVAQGVLGFAWRLQGPCVVAVGEDLAAAFGRAIDCAGQPDGEALHASGQRSAVAGLDNEMQMVSLHRVVEQSKAETVFASDERLFDLSEASPRGEGRYVGADTKRDVRRMVSRVGWSSDVGNTAAGVAGPTRTVAAAAMGSELERELLAARSRRAAAAFRWGRALPHALKIALILSGASLVFRKWVGFGTRWPWIRLAAVSCRRGAPARTQRARWWRTDPSARRRSDSKPGCAPSGVRWRRVRSGLAGARGSGARWRCAEAHQVIVGSAKGGRWGDVRDLFS